MLSSDISFSKTMFPSCISNQYHMGWPREFCDQHLPRVNTVMKLVDETGKEFSVMYLVNGHRVVGASGWGGFVVANRLVTGDKLLFRLIDEWKFKVHITRASDNKLVDRGELEDLTEKDDACIGDIATQKQRPDSNVVDSYQDDMCCGVEERVDEEVLPKETNFSFYKELKRSQLHSEFDLRLPKRFCGEHLPSHDDYIILVDESEREYNVRYGVKGCRLACGWKGFAIAHGLLEGDIVFFHLVDRCKFKVHITRARRSIEKELQNNFVKKEDPTEDNACNGYTVAQKNSVPHAGDSCQMDRGPCVKKRGNVDVVPIEKVYVRKKYQSAEAKGAFDTESTAPSGIENPESALNLKCFKDFRICVNGEMLDSEIPEHVRMKYYELCCVEKRLLHDNVMKDLNSKLVVSMIQDIVSFSESTNATSITTRLHHLESMDKTLKYFEDSGMTVGSLRAKISKLIKILKEHHSVAESTIVRLEALECERRAFMEKKKKIDELIESAMAQGKLIGSLEENIDGSKEKMDYLSFMLKEVAGLTR